MACEHLEFGAAHFFLSGELFDMMLKDTPDLKPEILARAMLKAGIDRLAALEGEREVLAELEGLAADLRQRLQSH